MGEAAIWTTCACGRTRVQAGQAIKWVSCSQCPQERRWFKVLKAVDEFGHRHLPLMIQRLFLGLLCDWLDTQWLGESWKTIRGMKPRAQIRHYFQRA